MWELELACRKSSSFAAAATDTGCAGTRKFHRCNVFAINKIRVQSVDRIDSSIQFHRASFPLCHTHTHIHASHRCKRTHRKFTRSYANETQLIWVNFIGAEFILIWKPRVNLILMPRSLATLQFGCQNSLANRNTVQCALISNLLFGEMCHRIAEWFIIMFSCSSVHVLRQWILHFRWCENSWQGTHTGTGCFSPLSVSNWAIWVVAVNLRLNVPNSIFMRFQ